MEKEPKPDTYRYFARKLNLAQITCRKYGKEKCRRLLAQQNIEILSSCVAEEDRKQQICQAIKVLGTREMGNVVEMDAQARIMASRLLCASLQWLEDNLDHQELSIAQKAQMRIALIRVIAGGKA